jgi:hypothetical protein
MNKDILEYESIVYDTKTNEEIDISTLEKVFIL